MIKKDTCATCIMNTPSEVNLFSNIFLLKILKFEVFSTFKKKKFSFEKSENGETKEKPVL